jgi:hypothetical protein
MKVAIKAAGNAATPRRAIQRGRFRVATRRAAEIRESANRRACHFAPR